MFCPKCGTKNEDSAKFCKKCGAQLISNTVTEKVPSKTEAPEKKETKPVKEETPVENKKVNSEVSIAKKEVENKKVKPETPPTSGEKTNIFQKIWGIPLKFKIMAGVGLVAIIVIIVVLAVVLNNPVKKITNGFENYFISDRANRDDLNEIGNIIKKYKNDEKKLTEIKKEVHELINKYVADFNKEYKNMSDLETAYNNLESKLSSIHDFFGDFEYVLSDDEYYEITDLLDDLYDSKNNYLQGLGYENSDPSEAYDYYGDVIEEDCYYEKAQSFISNYVKEEIETLKTEANGYVNFAEDATDEVKLSGYINQLDYLDDNDYKNGIDLSTTEDYKTLRETAINNIKDLAKSLASQREKELDIRGAIKYINQALDAIYDSSLDAYKELSEIKTSLNAKLPEDLVDQYIVDDDDVDEQGSVTINDVSYEDNLEFRFNGEKSFITYRINNEFTRLRATIVRGENWPSEYKGVFVIYGDDKEIYRSSEVTKTGDFNDKIDIDVTNVNDLRIEFQTANGSDSWFSASFYIYIVEPGLYK